VGPKRRTAYSGVRHRHRLRAGEEAGRPRGGPVPYSLRPMLQASASSALHEFAGRSGAAGDVVALAVDAGLRWLRVRPRRPGD